MMYSINEIDVWKDATGYTINDVFRTGIKIDIVDRHTYEPILQLEKI